MRERPLSMESLMGSKKSKKKAKGKKKPSGRKPPSRKKETKLRTQFMRDFTARFIRDPDSNEWLFPKLGQPDLEVFQNLTDVVSVLGEKNAGGNPASGGTTSFRDQVIDFVTEQQWPDGTSIPAKFVGRERTVHLVEIAVIVDRMLEAVNAGVGGGGGGSSWPPHIR